MIEDASGDLFASGAEALVNAVNTAGVMGKGLALAFKQRYPDSFEAYRRAHAAGELAIGKVLVVERAGMPRWILHVPTKRHWRGKSKLDDIRAGLVDLVEQVRARAIASVAMPALGCGLGGLAWDDVRPMIVEACAGIPETRVMLYGPGGVGRPV
jgi:O-acetyl-ADP-ribose deacetylase (regulator of RNase III)